MKKLCWIFIACAFMAVGCSDDDNEKGNGGGDVVTDNITVPDGGQLEQSVYADNVAGQSGVSFTTKGAWTSTITESGATKATEAPAWVSISPDHGDKAGDYTISITLDMNYTGVKRSATIAIICGDSEINITVTQEGTKQDGKLPDKKLIKSLKIEHDNPLEMASTTTINFKYDQDNRLIKIEGITVFENGDEEGETDLTLTYSGNKINFSHESTWHDRQVINTDGSESYDTIVYMGRMIENMTATLNANGMTSAVSANTDYYIDSDGSGYLAMQTISSSEIKYINNAIQSVSYKETNYDSGKVASTFKNDFDCTWENKNLTRINLEYFNVRYHKYDTGRDTSAGTDYAKAEYNSLYENNPKVNFDLNWLIADNDMYAEVDGYALFNVLDLLGQRSIHMLSATYDKKGQQDWTYSYKLDSEGFIQEVKSRNVLEGYTKTNTITYY